MNKEGGNLISKPKAPHTQVVGTWIISNVDALSEGHAGPVSVVILAGLDSGGGDFSGWTWLAGLRMAF